MQILLTERLGPGFETAMPPQSSNLRAQQDESGHSQTRTDGRVEGDLNSPCVSVSKNGDPLLDKPGMKSISRTPATNAPGHCLLIILRSTVLLAALAVYLCNDIIQVWVDAAWGYLLSAWWFQSVYFETVWATLCYAYIIPLYPFTMHYVPWFNRYKVDKSITYVHQTVVGILLDAVVYMAPLAVMDTFMVKKYCGVHPEQWVLQRQDWIQTTRALPLAPPSVWQLVYQVIGGVLIYDMLFFVIHLTLHKYRPLYNSFHACHHDHDIMHAHVTNQLSVGERIMLILAANQALKMLYSHPMSRTLFVPVFIFLLVENHSGYDLPWGLQHLVPGKLWGGPRLHYAHHMQGSRHYQPFLAYLDWALEWWEGRGCRKHC